MKASTGPCSSEKAIDHGLASLSGYTLARVTPDMVPCEILDAFGVNVDRTRMRNLTLFDELAGVIEALANYAVEAIAFKGPVIALQASSSSGKSTRSGRSLIRLASVARHRLGSVLSDRPRERSPQRGQLRIHSAFSAHAL